MWPLQDESSLTVDATSYVDDYLQAIESELCCDSGLLCTDGPFPDLYGATVNWEPMLQCKYAPTEQMSNSLYSYTAPAAVADQLCHSISRAGSTGCHASSSTHIWTDGKADSAIGNFPTTTSMSSLWVDTQKPRFETPNCLTSLLELAGEELSNEATNKGEVCVPPQDLILCGRRDSGSMQARDKHEEDVLGRYARAEQEIASLSRGALHGTVSTTRLDFQMDFGVNSRKRTLSDTEPADSPSRKRARASPTKRNKPELYVNCAVAPQGPKPQLFMSPLAFSIDSSTVITNSARSAYSSARFYQHQSSNQVYDFHQTYSYPPPSYPEPPGRSSAAPYWPGFSGYQPAWTPTRELNDGCGFVDMCQTSAYHSTSSAFSTGSEHIEKPTSATHVHEPAGVLNQTGDAQTAYFVSCLLKVKESLAAQQGAIAVQQGSIDEMLQLTALLGHH
ncbi:hypothetical protein AALT_g11048 [Alternaria alternata]|nr:hypothetical protein AALT_g11048 [Alternaria alternata]